MATINPLIKTSELHTQQLSQIMNDPRVTPSVSKDAANRPNPPV